MSNCPITYKNCGEQRFSREGLRGLSPSLFDLNTFSYTNKEMQELVRMPHFKAALPGTCPKLGVRLNVLRENFEPDIQNTKYIVKLQDPKVEMRPQNEDLTMRLAQTLTLPVPFHGLIYNKSGVMNYFVKRFDRLAKRKKVHVEDCAQLAGKSGELKYDYSLEKLSGILERYCTFPLIEKRKLFILTVFNFLVGNAGMHLKKYSLIVQNNTIGFTPFYGLRSTKLTANKPENQLALPLFEKKNELNQEVLIFYFGNEYLELNDVVINDTLSLFMEVFPKWEHLINRSFLTTALKEKYWSIIEERREIIGL